MVGGMVGKLNITFKNAMEYSGNKDVRSAKYIKTFKNHSFKGFLFLG